MRPVVMLPLFQKLEAAKAGKYEGMSRQNTTGSFVSVEPKPVVFYIVGGKLRENTVYVNTFMVTREKFVRGRFAIWCQGGFFFLFLDHLNHLFWGRSFLLG